MQSRIIGLVVNLYNRALCTIDAISNRVSVPTNGHAFVAIKADRKPHKGVSVADCKKALVVKRTNGLLRQSFLTKLILRENLLRVRRKISFASMIEKPILRQFRKTYFASISQNLFCANWQNLFCAKPLLRQIRLRYNCFVMFHSQESTVLSCGIYFLGKRYVFKNLPFYIEIMGRS